MTLMDDFGENKCTNTNFSISFFCFYLLFFLYLNEMVNFEKFEEQEGFI